MSIKQSQLADINVTNTAPTINDDNTLRYGVGSKWLDTTGPTYYICTDATTGAAVWVITTGIIGGTFTTVDGKTVTVTNGLITNIV